MAAPVNCLVTDPMHETRSAAYAASTRGRRGRIPSQDDLAVLGDQHRAGEAERREPREVTVHARADLTAHRLSRSLGQRSRAHQRARINARLSIGPPAP